MSKWADYCISEVSYNSAHTHINNVKTQKDEGDTLGTAYLETRQAVIANINAKKTYITVFRGSDGKWKQGQRVYVIRVNGIEFIKTVDNGKPADNLENLPEF